MYWRKAGRWAAKWARTASLMAGAPRDGKGRAFA
jgi:hypothetical protein